MNEQSTVALVLSSVSIGLSVAALGWQMIHALRIDVARLRVTARAAIIVPADDPEEVVIVQCVNVGKRPTELKSLWLEGGRKYRWWYVRLLPRAIRDRIFKNFLIMPGQQYASLSTRLPTTLEVGGTAQLLYPHAIVAKSLTKVGKSKAWGTATASTARGESRKIKIL